MSLVGWRPCTKNEWDQYNLEHRIRAGMKPGITGMWQVSGRSEITDFDEVVRLDQEYIENWSLLLDRQREKSIMHKADIDENWIDNI